MPALDGNYYGKINNYADHETRQRYRDSELENVRA